MEKTKFCVVGGCNKEATLWKGFLIKSRDMVSAGFCDEHSNRECRNAFGKKDVYGIYSKDLGLVRRNYKPKTSINIIEQ